jgi:acetone carboxylase gamma subunit
MKDLPVIRCCHCGHEYMPSEIFMPEAFFGKQKNIFRSVDGQIEFYDGTDPDFVETYICDNCGTPLDIEARISFKVEEHKDDFEEEYVSKINKPAKITLDEEPLF